MKTQVVRFDLLSVPCVPHLFVNLCKLVQVILKKGNLLLLGARPPAIIRFHFGTLERR